MRTFCPSPAGFCTAKGDLITSILYPKPVSFKFYKDSVKFVLFLAVLGREALPNSSRGVEPRLPAWLCNGARSFSRTAFIGTLYSILILVKNQVGLQELLNSRTHVADGPSTDAWAARCPPRLCTPCALGSRGANHHPCPRPRHRHRAAGSPGRYDRGHHLRPEQAEETGHLLHQPSPHQPVRQDPPGLLRQGEFGAALRRGFHLGGWSRPTALSPQTGTLTEEGLDVWGVVPLENHRFMPIAYEPRHLPAGPLLYALAACHTVSLLRAQPIGDPVDLKMMESTGWVRKAAGGGICPQGDGVLLCRERRKGVLKPSAGQNWGLQGFAVVSAPGDDGGG